MSTEKRQFQRLAINMNGLLNIADEVFDVQVLDLSLQGVRVRLNNDMSLDISHPLTLTIQPNEDSPVITLFGQITHVQHEAVSTPAATVLGMKLTHIPLDDLSALRRVLLLNSGEQDMDTHELMIMLDRIADSLPGRS